MHQTELRTSDREKLIFSCVTSDGQLLTYVHTIEFHFFDCDLNRKELYVVTWHSARNCNFEGRGWITGYHVDIGGPNCLLLRNKHDVGRLVLAFQCHPGRFTYELECPQSIPSIVALHQRAWSARMKKRTVYVLETPGPFPRLSSIFPSLHPTVQQ